MVTARSPVRMSIVWRQGAMASSWFYHLTELVKGQESDQKGPNVPNLSISSACSEGGGNVQRALPAPRTTRLRSPWTYEQQLPILYPLELPRRPCIETQHQNCGAPCCPQRPQVTHKSPPPFVDRYDRLTILHQHHLAPGSDSDVIVKVYHHCDIVKGREGGQKGTNGSNRGLNNSKSVFSRESKCSWSVACPIDNSFEKSVNL
jgi:hypothetical protein